MSGPMITFPQLVSAFTGMPVALAQRAEALAEHWHRTRVAEGRSADSAEAGYRAKWNTMAFGCADVPGVGVDYAAAYAGQEAVACFGDEPKSYELIMRWLGEWQRERRSH